MSALPNPITNQKIAVVDDNPASLYSTSRILRSAGFTVIEASTGAEALGARSNTAYLPIIHLTATFIANDDMVQGLSAGGDSYLTHPVDPLVLIATVRALLFARQAGENRHRVSGSGVIESW